MNLFSYCNAQGQSCVAMTQNGCKGERVLWCDSPVRVRCLARFSSVIFEILNININISVSLYILNTYYKYYTNIKHILNINKYKIYLKSLFVVCGMLTVTDH